MRLSVGDPRLTEGARSSRSLIGRAPQPLPVGKSSPSLEPAPTHCRPWSAVLHTTVPVPEVQPSARCAPFSESSASLLITECAAKASMMAFMIPVAGSSARRRYLAWANFRSRRPGI